MSLIDKTMEFMKMMHAFQNVERIAPVLRHNRLENDSEHSYSLAMLAWYLIDKENLDLDKNKILAYALIHDLVEVHAGDTYAFEKNHTEKDSKGLREKEALEKIQKDFPEFKDLHRSIDNYESRKDNESRFVYALDKVVPVITIYLDANERTSFWKKHKISLKLLKKYKDSKVAVSPDVTRLWQELVELLEKDRERLFPKDSKD